MDQQRWHGPPPANLIRSTPLRPPDDFPRRKFTGFRAQHLRATSSLSKSASTTDGSPSTALRSPPAYNPPRFSGFIPTRAAADPRGLDRVIDRTLDNPLPTYISPVVATPTLSSTTYSNSNYAANPTAVTSTVNAGSSLVCSALTGSPAYSATAVTRSHMPGRPSGDVIGPISSLSAQTSQPIVFTSGETTCAPSKAMSPTATPYVAPRVVAAVTHMKSSYGDRSAVYSKPVYHHTTKSEGYLLNQSTGYNTRLPPMKVEYASNPRALHSNVAMKRHGYREFDCEADWVLPSRQQNQPSKISYQHAEYIQTYERPETEAQLDQPRLQQYEAKPFETKHLRTRSDEAGPVNDELQGAEWLKEIAALRLKQLHLLHEENIVLQTELDKSRQESESTAERILTLEHSLNLFAEVLLSWLKSLPPAESRRILNGLLDVLGRHEKETLKVPEPAAESCAPRDLKARLERATAELEAVADDEEVEEESLSPPLSSGIAECRDDLTEGESLGLPPTAPRRTPSKVPPLKLSSVGHGNWLAGEQTAGDTYAPSDK